MVVLHLQILFNLDPICVMGGLNIQRVTGKTRISYSGDVCKLVEPKAFLVFLVVKLVERFSRHCLAKKELHTLRPSDPDEKC